MILVTGDTHGEQARMKYYMDQCGAADWTEDDYLIVCGDFGYLFADDLSEHAFLDDLAGQRWQILFVDGNHENFPAIFRCPEEKWHGGRVHRIRQNIRHLMRGQVFEIEGKTFFTMGGAYSIDRALRKEGFDWWEQWELPTQAEYAEAGRNLAAHDHRVDYILSHTCPQELIYLMSKSPNVHDAELTAFLSKVSRETEFSHWYFGHWHEERAFGERFTLLWYETRRIL